MTFNPAIAKTVQQIRKFLPEEPTVIELGSQTLTVKFEDKPEIKTTPQFYEALGFVQYDAVDTDGKGTVSFDLNNVLDNSGPKYDLVTNSGTGEHIFNQYAIFNNVHNLCKPGGLMIHVLPWINWQNHGFYNFNPILFHDLARWNRYHKVALWACDRNGENMFDPVIEENKNPEPTDINFFVIAVLQKRYDRSFVAPQQTKYDTIIDPLSFKDGFIWPDDIETKPFPYFKAKLQDDLYDQLEKEWPKNYSKFKGWGGNEKNASNVLEQYSIKDILFDRNISPLWRAFMEYTTSGHFFQEMVKRFSPHIQGLYPITQIPLDTGRRGLDDKNFILDSQFAINTPVSSSSRVRGPHVDDPRELYAGLLYMPNSDYDSGGNLELYQWKGKREFVSRKGMAKKNECRAKDVKLVDTIPYEKNTMVFFLNTPDSIHGVSPRRKTDQYRRYINITAEAREPLFKT